MGDFMGHCRMVDFSQFRPRGHYTHSERLERCDGPERDRAPARRHRSGQLALFYRAIHWDDSVFHRKYGAGGFDALVADIHTDLPSPDSGDPGSVLHQGVGRVNLLMLTVESGGDRLVCAGPVLSHYEFEVIGAPRRLTDIEWAGGGEGTRNPLGILQGAYPGDVPPDRLEGLQPPPWTRGYLVPSR